MNFILDFRMTSADKGSLSFSQAMPINLLVNWQTLGAISIYGIKLDYQFNRMVNGSTNVGNGSRFIFLGMSCRYKRTKIRADHIIVT